MCEAITPEIALLCKIRKVFKAKRIKDEQGVLLIEKKASLKTFGTVSFLAVAHLLGIAGCHVKSKASSWQFI